MKTLRSEETMTPKIKDNLSYEQLFNCGKFFQNNSLVNSGFLEGKSPLCTN
jgi:hypothetical protein